MEKSLLKFANRLRSSGVSISPAEALDAGRALEQVGLETRSTVKDALRSALIKRGRDIPLFDALFDLYFQGGGLARRGGRARGRGAGGREFSV